ncbi:PREDICTED: uncharacterized protein LOC109155074 [Ipomoea nil]|uniref:uncharacterized protein LOC109155074 n=1 Tax=Ipomoea nil TaxID=35883 RepID=UPI000901CE8A|nr:PREDICTED: uncharacterized protein LOC109155074 [Ipomoea nil]
MNVIGSKWVYRVKRKSDGSIDRYKAHLVAKGFNQIPSIDYIETYSPVVKLTTIRLLLSFAVSNSWVMRQLDVHNAFLNGHISEDIYMRQPPGNVASKVDSVLTQLATTFKIRDHGKPRFFLGVEAVYTADAVVLSQHRYMTELLRKAGLESCKPLATPMTNATADASGESSPLEDPSVYRQLVGSLMYLLLTHPDLSFAVNRLCQFMHNPTQDNWAAVKRVLRYVKGTLHLGLRLTASSAPVVHAFSDSDWVGCSLDRKSTAGYVVFFGPNLLSWSSRKQRTVARSSTEAEYKALADVAAEVVWVQSLLQDLGLQCPTTPVLWCDNLGATYLCSNPVFHARTKHVEVDYHFVRDKVSTGAMKVNFVSTHDQLADIFTKPLSTARFNDLRFKLGVVSTPPSA